MTSIRWGAAIRAMATTVALGLSLGACGPSLLDQVTTQSIAGSTYRGTAAVSSRMPEPANILVHAARLGGHLPAYSATRPPAGFTGFCDGQPWACGEDARSTVRSEAAIIRLVERVNRQVNSSVREMHDIDIVGQAEYWSLPINGAGDCEDFALLKKKMLQEAGVPANRLALATAINRRSEAHAVLVLRLSSGDLVLDNLTSSILNWRQTGYTFLKMQRFDDQYHWDLVLVGPRAANRT